MKYISKYLLLLISISSFTNSYGRTDSTINSKLSESFYEKLSEKILTKSNIECCNEIGESYFKSLEVVYPVSAVYFASDGFSEEEYLNEIVDSVLVDEITDYLINQCRLTRLVLELNNNKNITIYTCLESTVNTKKSYDAEDGIEKIELSLYIIVYFSTYHVKNF